MDYAQFLLDNLPTVEQAVRYIARRHRLAPHEAEDLSSAIKLKLVERDYEVLRKFQGRSTLSTYLKAIVHRHFLDERIARWGKWRPSMQARRLDAVLLDQLLTRDGMSIDEAAEALRTNHGLTYSRESIADIASQLPPRQQRHFVGEDALEGVAAPSGRADTALQQSTAAAVASHVEDALAAALEPLSAEDVLILKSGCRTTCKWRRSRGCWGSRNDRSTAGSST